MPEEIRIIAPTSGPRQPRGPNPFFDLLTTGEVAAMKGVTERWVRHCIETGKLAAWSAGGLYFVPLGEAEAWRTGIHPRSAAAKGTRARALEEPEEGP